MPTLLSGGHSGEGIGDEYPGSHPLTGMAPLRSQSAALAELIKDRLIGRMLKLTRSNHQPGSNGRDVQRQRRRETPHPSSPSLRARMVKLKAQSSRAIALPVVEDGDFPRHRPAKAMRLGSPKARMSTWSRSHASAGAIARILHRWEPHGVLPEYVGWISR
jgi:hypothetical protein